MPRITARQALALGLVHGPAELVPVSSSGHTTLLAWQRHWNFAALDPAARKRFEVALHAGTTAALLLAGRRELAATLRRRTPGASPVAVRASAGRSRLPPASIRWLATSLRNGSSPSTDSRRHSSRRARSAS